jgi:frataxin-like iron-binding protein CyaY
LFIFDRDAQGIRYQLAIKQGNMQINLRNKKTIVITDQPCNVVIDQVWYHFTNIDSKKISPFVTKEFIQIAKSAEQAYFEKFILNTVRNFSVQAQGFEINEQQPKPKPLLYFQNDLEGLPVLILKFRYASKIILPNNADKVFVDFKQTGDQVVFNKTIRDGQAETDAVSILQQWGLYSKDQVHFYIRNMQEGPQTDWFYATVSLINQLGDTLKKHGFEIKQEFFSKKYI